MMIIRQRRTYVDQILLQLILPSLRGATARRLSRFAGRWWNPEPASAARR
ncbi:MAG: hypothetical protein HY329_20555 [Chloroflexi bacterium]|nr:hypothetical protein [Chloroflexota bacterium]